MALKRPSVSITYDIDTLEVEVSNVIAIRQTEIAVTIEGGSDLAAQSPILMIQALGNNGATTSIMSLAVWTTSGSDIIGTISSNTTQAISAFADAGNIEEKPFNVLLYLDGNTDLQFNGVCKVKNNPNASTETPTDAGAALLAGKVGYIDFASVTDLVDGASWGTINLKVNEILGLLRND